MASIQQSDSSDTHPIPGKNMSMYSFKAPKASKLLTVTTISTSPGQVGSSKHSLPARSAKSPTSAKSPSVQLSSPICSPVMETDSLIEKPNCNIFERSVQETTPAKQEDFIPPALDATAEILSDKDTNLDDVEMIYSSRRNSSVIGLNMALRRPYTPLRKSSVQSMSHFNPNLASSASNVSPQSPVSPPKLSTSRSSVSFYSYADMIINDEFSRRPSVMHSYSHGVVPTMSSSMAGKLSLTLAHSSGSFVGAPAISTPSSGLAFSKLSRKTTSNSVSSSHSQSQLLKQIKDSQTLHRLSNPNEPEDKQKFLISPESLDSEDQEPYYPVSAAVSDTSSRRKSLISLHLNDIDDESLVSTSFGDCIRKCTTEIGGHHTGSRSTETCFLRLA